MVSSVWYNRDTEQNRQTSTSAQQEEVELSDKRPDLTRGQYQWQKKRRPRSLRKKRDEEDDDYEMNKKYVR